MVGADVVGGRPAGQLRSSAPTPIIGPAVTARGGSRIQRVRTIHRPNPNTSGGTNPNTSRSPACLEQRLVERDPLRKDHP